MSFNIYNITPKYFIQKILLDFSLICAILSLTLWGFNYFPYNLISVGPSQLHLSTSFIGFISFFLSFIWLPLLTKHKKLFIATGLLCLWGYIITKLNAVNYPYSVEFNAILRYRGWLLFPMLYFSWIALLFSIIEKEKGKKIFIYAVLGGFCINALHMVAEIFANIGFNSVKDFLISINPYFRLEKIAQGWWPPPYYESRIRGIYAEPSHMVGGILPAIGIFWYLFKKNAQKAWFLIIAILYGIFIWGNTYTGLLAVGAFLIAACIYSIYQRFGFKITSIASCIGAALVLGLFLHFLYTTEAGKKIHDTMHACAIVVDYFEKRHDGIEVEPVNLNTLPEISPKIFSRAALALLDMSLAKLYPLGVGLGLKSEYFSVLSTCDLKGYDLEQWVKQRHIPTLTAYTNYAAELGFISLICLGYMIGLTMFRMCKLYKQTKDEFIPCMFLVFIAYAVVFFTQRVDTTFSFIYFLAFLYAYSSHKIEIKPNN